MKKDPWKKYFELFAAMFSLSAFTFGGGYVMIPLMKKKFVDDKKWLTEEEMLNMAALAQSAPGPMAVNAALLIGRQIMGWGGALVAVVGTVLPPLITLSVVSLFYVAFRDHPVVSAVLKGMMAGVCAVIFDVVATMGGKVVKARNPLPMLILLGAFAATYVLNINVVYIILACAALGVVVGISDHRRGKEHL